MAAGTEPDAGAADDPVSSYWQKYVVDGYKLKKIVWLVKNWMKVSEKYKRKALFGEGFVCVQDIREWGFFIC